MKILKTFKGFTLIELIIVLSIVGIIAGIIISVIDPLTLQKKSRDARRKADLEAIRQALELYRADDVNKYYPGSTASLVPNYISSLPVEPDDKTAYDYGPTPGAGSATSYDLCTVLEIDGSSYCVYNP